LALSFAVSIVLIVVIAAILPVWQASPQREFIARVLISRILAKPIPTPAPMPTPPPPPRVISHSHVIAPSETRTIAKAATGKSARKEIVHRIAAARPKSPVLSHARPVWDVPVGAQGAGAGNRSGAGSIGSGGSGSGAGKSGTGNGAAAGNQPCGFVDFSDPHGSQYDPRTHGFWVDIRMTVRFPDGQSQSILLDYPWYYPNEASNPWSNQNLNNPNFPTRFQPPPPDKAAGEPPLVQYVIQHSTRDGFTLLKDCPNDEATPAPPPLRRR
jgi:hypothetical protein